jgi:putative membrane protein
VSASDTPLHHRTSATASPRRRDRRRGFGAGIAVFALVLLGWAGVGHAAPSSQDTQWMQAAHQSNLAEIAAGSSAQAHATTDAVRRLGAEFVQMHTELDADLTAAAQQLGIQLPDAPTAAQQQALADVESHSGSAYDEAWVAQQQQGHQEALQATKTETTAGSDTSVIGLATAALPVVQRHLDELNALAANNGSPTLINTGDGGQAAAGSPSRYFAPTGLALLGVLLVAGASWATMRARRRI